MSDMPPFAELPESVRTIMKASIEQAQKAFNTFIASSQKAIQGLDGASPMATEGLKTLNDKIAEFTRLNADANFRLALRLADAKQLSDVIQIQNAHVREQMETFTRQLEEIRALTTQVVKEASQKAAAAMPGAASSTPETPATPGAAGGV